MYPVETAESGQITQGLPVRQIVLPDFDCVDYAPKMIRRKRMHGASEFQNASISTYLRTCGDNAILDRDDVLALFTEIHWRAYHIRKIKGDIAHHMRMISEAEEQLLLAHLPVVVKLAKSFDWKGDTIDDLLQVGACGIIMAIRRYDFTSGVPFFYYARISARNQMIDHIRSLLRERGRNNQSLDSEAGLEADQNLYGIIGDSTVPPAFSGPDCTLVVKMVEQLAGRHRQIIEMYYMQEMTLQEIGTILGLSKMRIGQIRDQALGVLRAQFHPSP